MPPESAWIDVRCYDLAQGGFSFFLDEKPTFERLVARFRSAEPIYVAARVNHWRPVLVDGWGGIIEPGIPAAGAMSAVRRQRIEVPRRLPVPAAVHALRARVCCRPDRSRIIGSGLLRRTGVTWTSVYNRVCR